MSHKTEIIEIRDVAKKFASNGKVPTSAADSARYLLKSIREEALEHGFTEADVIRAVLRTVFKQEKGCDCYSCAARRAKNELSQSDAGPPRRMRASVE